MQIGNVIEFGRAHNHFIITEGFFFSIFRTIIGQLQVDNKQSKLLIFHDVVVSALHNNWFFLPAIRRRYWTLYSYKLGKEL